MESEVISAARQFARKASSPCDRPREKGAGFRNQMKRVCKWNQCAAPRTRAEIVRKMGAARGIGTVQNAYDFIVSGGGTRSGWRGETKAQQ